MGYTPQTFPTDQQFTWQLSPQQQAQAQTATQNTVRAIPQQAWGRLDPFQIAQTIEKMHPDLDPEAKLAAVTGLVNLMSAGGKQQFAEMMQMANYQQRGALGQETRDIQQQRLDVEKQRLAQGGAGNLAQKKDVELFGALEAAKTPEEKKAAEQAIDDWNRAQGKGATSSRSAVGAMRAGLKTEHPDWNEDQVEDALLDFRRLSSIESGFGSGVLGRNVVSLNTVADHAQRVRTYFEALNNGNIPRANQIANTISVETGGPEVTEFNTGATIMTGEVVRLLTTTGGTEADRERMLGLINARMSQAQGKGALDVFDDMINARFESLRTQYAQGRPDREKKFDTQFLTPASRALHESVSRRARGQQPAEQTSAGGAPSPSLPAGGMPVPQEHAKDPDGTTYDGSDGKVWIKQGAALVPQ